MAAYLLGLASPLHSTEGTNSLVTIIAAPVFEQRGEWVSFLITNRDRTARLWGLDGRSPVPGVSLDTNKAYEFIFTNQSIGNSSVLDLLRVRQDGKTIYDFETCEVHRLKMQRKKARIIYGLVRPSPGEPSAETERELFPHRREIAWGGCAPAPEKTMEVLVCGQCKAAYERWKIETRARGVGEKTHYYP